MAKIDHPDISIKSFVLDILYGEGNYPAIPTNEIATRIKDSGKFNVNNTDIVRALRGIIAEKLIKTKHGVDGEELIIADDGVIVIKTHGSYINYYKNNQKSNKETIERNDRRIKNVGILATLIISIIALILTQFPIQKDKEQEKIREDIQSVAKELDSLKQVLRNIPTQTESKPKLDTATSK